MLKNRYINILFGLIALSLFAWDSFGDVSGYLYLAAIFVYAVIQAYGATVLSSNFFVDAKTRGSQQNTIALTFDDGPIPHTTEKILDVLKEEQAPAAFFCIGNRVAASPGIVKRIVDEGHVVGNHSYWHGKLFDLQSASAIANELKATDDAIGQVIGSKPLFFRPPYGVTNPMVASGIAQSGHTVVGWSIRSFDTTIRNPDKLLRRITTKMRSGDIILFHDYSLTTIEVLPKVIAHARKIGLKVVRLDVLLNEKAYVS